VIAMVAGRPVLVRVRRSGGRRVPLGLVLLGALAVLALAGSSLTSWRWDDVDLSAFGTPPSARHWLGTTRTGRDMYAVTLRGLRASLLTGLLVAVSATGLATIVGAAAGYLGGWTDRVLTGVAELLLVLPPLLVVASLTPALRGAGLPTLALTLAAFMWMVTARLVRTTTLALRDQDHVLAARLLGAGPLRIVLRHIVPNLAPLVLADATLNVGAAVIAETSLSYLGLGARPPDVSLGTVIADGTPSATVFPWLFLPPVTVLVVLLLAVNLIGDGLRDALDPEYVP
jgi:peptide/nickel transport system permease protein